MSEATAPKTALPDASARSFGRNLRYLLEAAGFFLIVGFFRVFDIDRASAIGGWIGRNLVGRTYLSRRPLRNLRTAFPDKSETEIRAILNAMWDNLGRVMGEYPHLDRLHWAGAAPRITMSGEEYLNEAKAHSKGVMLVSGHLANWEIMPFVGREYGFTGGTVVRPPNNPYVSRWMERVRARNGMQEQIPKGPQGVRRTFSLLRRGDAICLLVDQRTSEGIKVPFFGRDAFTTPAPAALALKLGAVIVPVSNVRTRGAHFHMRAYPIIEPPNTGDPDRDLVELTSRITRFIEDRVRENPGQWLWIHKRWVKDDAPLGKRAHALSQDGR
ncbi:MAG TPA: lysophospholipid acyltransferase family protein [Micropepsaceae bacterium]